MMRALMKWNAAAWRVARDRTGATAIEYALIAGIIALGVVGGAAAVGSSTNESFGAVNERVWP
jgi:pilus assembly protein Flp/PilA